MPAPPSNTAAQKLSSSPNPNPAPQRGRQLRVLVIEDDPPVRDACLEVAAGMGFVTAAADSIASAHQALTQPVDIVLLDLKLPGGNGLSLLDEIHTRHPSAIIIIMTAYASVDSAVEALRTGVGDYLAKPFTFDELASTLERAAERRTFDVEARELRERLRSGRGQGQLIGRSPGMEKLYRILSKVAFTTHPVLIFGEPGTGKGVVARAIHLNGPRSAEPFVTVECSTLAPAAIEAQLFGASKQPALLAQPGTLFLDEIGSLTPDLQAKLVRALESRQFHSPASVQPLPVAARLLASSSRDLQQLVENGHFRKDLFYRLNVINLRLPPLRERKEDIPLLVASAVQRLQTQDAPAPTIAQDVLRLLLDYDWPGNVRELNHAIERAFALTSGPVLHLGDFPTQLQNAEREFRLAAAQDPATEAPALTVEVRSIADMEKQAILSTLRQLNGDKLQAARLLGIGKTTLYRKLKEYGVSDADLQGPA
jgi:two-component system response regulator HydG